MTLADWNVVAVIIGTVVTIIVAVVAGLSGLRKIHLARKTKTMKLVDVTYYTLGQLVGAKNDSSRADGVGLTKKELTKEVIKVCNANTKVDDSHRKKRDKDINKLIPESIELLIKPKGSPPLIEILDPASEVYFVTEAGTKAFESLPGDRAKGAESLDDILRGSKKFLKSESKASTSAGAEGHNKTTFAGRPKTHAEWRYAVFMAGLEDDAFDRDFLVEELRQKFFKSWRGRPIDDKIDQSITYNLNKKFFEQQADGRLRHSVPKESKTLIDFD